MSYKVNIVKSYNAPLGVTPESVLMLQVYADLGLPLEGREKWSMVQYVESEVISGNHSLKDYETIYSLQEPNSLVDFIGGKVATKVNAPIWSLEGYIFNGLDNYIKSNYIPSIDGINYTLNDSQIDLFVYQYSNFNISFASVHDLLNNVVGIVNSPIQILYRVNDISFAFAVDIPDNKSLLTALRNLVNAEFYLKDGIQIHTNGGLSVGIPQLEVYIGCRNLKGVPNIFLNGIISTFKVSGAIGFNTLSYNTNLRNLLTNLGLTL